MLVGAGVTGGCRAHRLSVADGADVSLAARQASTCLAVRPQMSGQKLDVKCWIIVSHSLIRSPLLAPSSSLPQRMPWWHHHPVH